MDPHGIELIRPTIFEDVGNVVAAFTTRHGGVSDEPYKSLNLSMSTNDKEENIQENRERVARALGLDVGLLTMAGQVHADGIKAVVSPGLYKGYDGMVTQRKGIWLALTAADCASVLLADPGSNIIAACHAGWRGAAARVVVKTVKAIRRAGAVVERTRAWISPCISVEQFEVGEEVAGEFHRDFVERREEWARPHVDLKAALREQLSQAGLADKQIEMSPECTASNTSRFFSHRAEGGTTGRMLGIISLQGG